MNLFPGSSKCGRPKMSDHRGATWDSCRVIDINGADHNGYLDTSWGQYFYFMEATLWRKARIDKFMDNNSTRNHNIADFRNPSK